MSADELEKLVLEYESSDPRFALWLAQFMVARHIDEILDDSFNVDFLVRHTQPVVDSMIQAANETLKKFN